jgi:sulfite exporter TauE/SafE
MCGPLVLSLPVHRTGPGRAVISITLYHTGRILVYATGGLLFGLLGRHVYLAGWQQGLSILLGIVILGNLVFKSLRVRAPRFTTPLFTPPIFSRLLFSRLQTVMARLWQSPSTASFFLMGMANGLLPCGMVYLAIAAALTSPTIPQAVGFMAFFGMGTLPLLLALQLTGQMVSVSLRSKIRRGLPYLTALMAILLIFRGLNLGIPYISPMLALRPGQVISCH